MLVIGTPCHKGCYRRQRLFLSYLWNNLLWCKPTIPWYPKHKALQVNCENIFPGCGTLSSWPVSCVQADNEARDARNSVTQRALRKHRGIYLNSYDLSFVCHGTDSLFGQGSFDICLGYSRTITVSHHTCFITRGSFFYGPTCTDWSQYLTH